MLFSNCAISSKKKTTIIKNTELHNFDEFKMNKIINKFLLTGDRFMPELHLKHPGFTYSACGPFTKHREIIQKSRETGKLKHIYRNQLDKAFLAHDAACSDSKDLAEKKTISDKTLRDRAYEIAGNRNYDGYKKALESMVCKFFDKKKKRALV